MEQMATAPWKVILRARRIGLKGLYLDMLSADFAEQRLD
jgi:hypothetical protein